MLVAAKIASWLNYFARHTTPFSNGSASLPRSKQCLSLR